MNRNNCRYLLKKILCLLLLPVVINTVIGGCGSVPMLFNAKLKPSRYIQIGITDKDGNATTYTDESIISYYIEAINSAETTDDPLPSEPFTGYRIMLEGKKARHSREFTLYVDESLENRDLFISTDKGLRKISDIYYNNLLAEPVFEPLYPHRIPPVVTLQYHSENYGLAPDSLEWKFRKTDMKYYDSVHDKPGSNGDIVLTVSDARLPAIHAADEPDTANWILLQNDQEIYSAESGQNNELQLEDGKYQCLLELQWLENKNRGFYGKAQYSFDIQIDNPPEIRISSLETLPGELLVIVAEHVNEDENVTITTDIDFKPNVFGTGSERVILLPVSYFHKSNKTYSINVTVGDISETFEVKVNDKEFTIQYLTIDTKIAAATRNDESAREVTEKIDPLRPVCDEVQYWEGTFLQPVEGGRVRAYDFGKRRYVNNSPTSYRHNGLDIGQDEGTPVKAVNNGRVLFADYMIGTGYTIIIEHGYGLKSWYYHMVSLDAKAGDMVKKGEVIGYVGSTGFSTGPHLHLAISVNNVFVNPMSFFEEGVPLLPGTSP